MKGIDCTAAITLTTAKALKDQGIGFVCRYLVPVKYAWKRLIKAEAQAIIGAGLKLLTIYEDNAAGAKKGAAEGTNDGKTALAEARLVGMPTTQPDGKPTAIYFAVDFDAQPADMPAILAYFKAAEKEIFPYAIGAYGSYDVCEYLFKNDITHLWQCYAWSHGKVSTHANVYQHQNGATVCGIACDLDDSFGGEGFWNSDSTPVERDDNMTVINFQKKYGLAADGVVGSKTIAKFLEVVDKLTADNTALQNKVSQIKKVLEG